MKRLRGGEAQGLRKTAARLLLVDDNCDNLELLSVVLGEQYTVAGYGSAAEGLTALEAVRPDVVVLDIGMAPLDGVQCLNAIRAVAGYARIPAIAVTAHARDVDRQAFLAAGFQEVLTKPLLDPQDLIAAIDRVLVSRRVLTDEAGEGILSARGAGWKSPPEAA